MNPAALRLARAATHVIFDLDGVLLDTEPLYTQATQRVLDPYGKIFDWSVKQNMIGRSSLESARYLVETLGLPLSPEDYLRERQPLLERLFTQAVEIPGARAFVERLVARAVPIAVATSSEAAYFRLKTAHHPWFSLFQRVVCGDDPRVRSLKPAPDIFLLAAEELGASPEQCLVIEDSPAGVEAARSARMQVIAIPDANVPTSLYTEATVVVRSFAELDLTELGF